MRSPRTRGSDRFQHGVFYRPSASAWHRDEIVPRPSEARARHPRIAQTLRLGYVHVEGQVEVAQIGRTTGSLAAVGVFETRDCLPAGRPVGILDRDRIN